MAGKDGTVVFEGGDADHRLVELVGRNPITDPFLSVWNHVFDDRSQALQFRTMGI